VSHHSLNARRKVAGGLRQLAHEYDRAGMDATARLLCRAANMIKRAPGTGRRPRRGAVGIALWRRRARRARVPARRAKEMIFCLTNRPYFSKYVRPSLVHKE
jgi:hypothetical protein